MFVVYFYTGYYRIYLDSTNLKKDVTGMELYNFPPETLRLIITSKQPHVAAWYMQLSTPVLAAVCHTPHPYYKENVHHPN
jgi:hypothetical protein